MGCVGKQQKMLWVSGDYMGHWEFGSPSLALGGRMQPVHVGWI